MLYEVAHFLRDKCPFIWDAVGKVNSIAFKARYGSSMKQIDEILRSYSGEFEFKDISSCQASEISKFFARQPVEAFTHFKPHGFDDKDINKLQCDNSFLAYAVLDGDKVIGYLFLRSYVWGKTYIGRMVDVNYRGRGIAKNMNRVTNEIARLLKLRVFRTISPENISSMKSAEAVNKLKVVKTLPNGDLLIENLPLD